jgi:hypothetical protein
MRVRWLVSAALIVVVAACSGASETPSVAPSPVVTPTPEPTPVPTLAPLPLPLKLVKATGPVAPSDRAKLTVRTIAQSTCTIDVQYDTVSSEAQGLDEKGTGDGTLITWTWIVGSNTAAGRWPIYVTCVKGDRTGKLATSILVK